MTIIRQFSARSPKENADIPGCKLERNAKCNQRRHHRTYRWPCWVTILVLSAWLVPLLILLSYVHMKDRQSLRRTGVLDWSHNNYRNVANYVMPHIDTTIIEPKNICDKKVFLLIVVCSSVNNFVARQNIRKTWGKTKQFNYHTFEQQHKYFKGKYLEPLPVRVEYYSHYLKSKFITRDETKYLNSTSIPKVIPLRIVFLVGRKKYDALLGNETFSRLRTEFERYHDIIQENFIDSYRNLTIKSVMMLKWVQKHCLHNVAFIMKCDDDTFVNVPNLLHVLLGGTIPLYNDTINMHDLRSYHVLANYNRLTLTHSVLMGRLFCGVKPIKDVSSKWFMPSNMFQGEIYPNYLSGSSYIMSSDVIPRLYLAALNTSSIDLEDIYITGICAQRAILRQYHSPLFSFLRSKYPCRSKGSITQHGIKDNAMFEVYALVNNESVTCTAPGKHFKTMLLWNGNCY